MFASTTATRAIGSGHTEFIQTYSKKVKLPGVNDIVPPSMKISTHTASFHQPTPVYNYSTPTLNIGCIPYRQDSSSPANLYTHCPSSPQTNGSSPVSSAPSTPSITHAVKFKPSPKQKYQIRHSNAWSHEDDLLLKYLKEARNLGWREISSHFQNRTANGCQFRWRRINALSKNNNSNIIILNERPSSVDVQHHFFPAQISIHPPVYPQAQVQQIQQYQHSPYYPPEYQRSVSFDSDFHSADKQLAHVQPQPRTCFLNLILNWLTLLVRLLFFCPNVLCISPCFNSSQ